MKQEPLPSQRDPERGDLFYLRQQESPGERTSAAWLIAQGIRYLHAVDEGGIQTYRHVVELLQSREDAPTQVAEALAAAGSYDIPMRWALLYILADLEHRGASAVFLAAATEPLPPVPEGGKGCTSIRDGEILVRTMAIAGLSRAAARDASVAKELLTLLRKIEEPALRVEIVKALLRIDPGHGETIRQILPEDQRFMAYLRRADPSELTIEHERQDGKDKLAHAPHLDRARTTPVAACHCEDN